MDQFLSTILIWPPDFAPRGWALCAGQLMSISQNIQPYLAVNHIIALVGIFPTRS